MNAFAVLAAPETPFLERLLVFALFLAFGIWMIYVGRLNVRARYAEEGGMRRLGLALLGKSPSMKGRAAVITGWVRIVCGAAAIVFGIVFLAFGAFLKE